VTARVPAKRRPRGPLTARERRVFLEQLAVGWSVTHAAAQAGRDRQRFYELRESNEDFAEAWLHAVEAGTQVLEDEARRRAVAGWEEPVFQQGELVGSVRKYSDQLLTLLLRGRRPAVYRESAPAAGSLVIVINERPLGELEGDGASAIVEGSAGALPPGTAS
jgi:hypothetical protein